jgi:chromosome partitioning protein
MRVITFCSFKGGTSKTSTALTVGACLAKFHQKRVLLVDFDPQANLSIGLGVGPDSELTMVPVLQGERDIRDVIQKTKTKNLSLIPANTYLDGVEKTPQFAKDLYPVLKLGEALKEVKNDYDVCFVDTPPSLGWLTQAAFLASNFTLICAAPEPYSVLALRRLKDFQEMIQKHHTISTLGVIISFWASKGADNKQVVDEIAKSFPGKLLESRVRRDIAVSRAVFQGIPVTDYDPESRASEDYKKLTKEILGLLEKSDPKAKLETLKNAKRKVGV